MCKGNANYNLNLSTNRAKSIRPYFINQGIAEKRIIAKGYGEIVQIKKYEPIKSCSNNNMN